MKILKWIWWVLKLTRAPIFALLLIVSLALNYSLFTGGEMYKAASSAFEKASGSTTVASKHASALAKLEKDAEDKEHSIRELQQQVVDIEGAFVDLKQELADEKSANERMQAEVAAISDRVSNRMFQAGAREIGSMAGKALPEMGTAVIVATTATQIADLCATAKDMTEIKRVFTPDYHQLPDEAALCDAKLPTKDALWTNVKTAPKAAWKNAKQHNPSIEDDRSTRLADVNWDGIFTPATGASE